MGLTAAQQSARRLLISLGINDPELTLRRACAYAGLSESVLRVARMERKKGDATPLEEWVRSLEEQGVPAEMARRICGMPGLDSDGPKRPRDAASEDGAASSSKASRATPADEVQSENLNDAESEGTRPPT